MNITLPTEILTALQQSPGNVLEVVDPITNRVYVVCDPELQQRAKAVLDRDAIAAGIRDMEAGRTLPIDEAFSKIRAKLKLRKNQ